VLKTKIITGLRVKGRDVMEVILPKQDHKLFNLDTAKFMDEEIIDDEATNMEMSEIYSELKTICHLLEKLVESKY